jgi:hypothetical protein
MERTIHLLEITLVETLMRAVPILDIGLVLLGEVI